MNRHGVLTGGIWCLDRNLMVTTWPQENGFAAVVDDRPCGGGASYNLGADLKSLDPNIPVAAIGLVGDDADGAFLIETAAAHGIDAKGIKILPGTRTDYTLAFASEDTGKRTHIGAFDAANKLCPDDFDFSDSTARLVHLGLPGIQKTMDEPWGDDASGWLTVLKKARRAGLKTSLELVSVDPATIAKIIRPCLPHLDLLVVNDHEMGAIAGRTTVGPDGTDYEACIEAAEEVLALGEMEIVAVHFPGGAIAKARTGTIVALPSVNVPEAEIMGANGAGDAFAAGFLYGWHEGWGLAECVWLAHCAAAASLRDITTTGAVEGWRECVSLAESWGWRQNNRLFALSVV